MKDMFTLYLQLPKPQKVADGRLDIDHKSTATFYTEGGTRCVAEMERVQIDSAAKVGIVLTGMQPCGVTKTGVPKYTYQKWLLSYME
jgi:hypothetical protein